MPQSTPEALLAPMKDSKPVARILLYSILTLCPKQQTARSTAPIVLEPPSLCIELRKIYRIGVLLFWCWGENSWLCCGISNSRRAGFESRIVQHNPLIGAFWFYPFFFKRASDQKKIPKELLSLIHIKDRTLLLLCQKFIRNIMPTIGRET